MNTPVPADSIFIALSAPGMGEWGVILILVLVLFGGKNIPDLAKALGNGIREFKRAMNGIGLDDLKPEQIVKKVLEDSNPQSAQKASDARREERSALFGAQATSNEADETLSADCKVMPPREPNHPRSS